MGTSRTELAAPRLDSARSSRPHSTLTPEIQSDHIAPSEAEDVDPFATEPPTVANSLGGSSSAIDVGRVGAAPRYFRSRRVPKGDIERPWLAKKDPREKWVTIIPCIGIFVGLAIASFLVWDGMRTVVNHQYCLILDDDFSNGLNTKIWTREAELGGFG